MENKMRFRFQQTYLVLNTTFLFCKDLKISQRSLNETILAFNTNKAGLFEGSFSWGRDPPFIFQEELI